MKRLSASKEKKFVSQINVTAAHFELLLFRATQFVSSKTQGEVGEEKKKKLPKSSFLILFHAISLHVVHF